MRTAALSLIIFATLGTALQAAEIDWTEQYQAALQQKVALQYEGTSAVAFIRALSQATGLSVAIHPELLENQRPSADLGVNLSVTDVKPETLLNLGAQLLGGEWGLVGHAVYICPRGEVAAEGSPGIGRRWIADFSPRLADQMAKPVEADFCEKRVPDVLRQLADQTGARLVLDQALEGLQRTTPLIVRQMPLKDALLWLARLWRCDFTEVGDALWCTERFWAEHRPVEPDVPPLPHPQFPGSDRKVTFEFIDMPLTDALAELSKQSPLPIVLAAEAVVRNPTISLALSNASLESALAYVSELAGLTYTLENDTILLTTPQDAFRRAPRTLKVHDVGDLVERGFANLDVLVKKLVTPRMWTMPDGGISVSVDQGQLVVVHIDFGHHRIEELLKALREERRAGFFTSPWAISID